MFRTHTLIGGLALLLAGGTALAQAPSETPAHPDEMQPGELTPPEIPATPEDTAIPESAPSVPDTTAPSVPVPPAAGTPAVPTPPQPSDSESLTPADPSVPADPSAPARPSDSMAPAQPGEATQPGQAVTPPSGQQMLGGFDQQFVPQAAAAGMAEVKLSELALQNGTAAIRPIAERMRADHSTANARLQAIATQKGISLPTQLPAEKQEVFQRLSKLTGAEFDSAYRDALMASHQRSMQLFVDEIKQGKDLELLGFSASTLPVIIQHVALLHAAGGMGAAPATKSEPLTPAPADPLTPAPEADPLTPAPEADPLTPAPVEPMESQPLTPEEPSTLPPAAPEQPSTIPEEPSTVPEDDSSQQHRYGN